MGNIKKNAVYNMLLSVSQIVFPLITFPYVTRILMPNGLGAVTFVDNYTQYFILIAALGIPVYGVREIAKVSRQSDKKDLIFSDLVTIHAITTLLLTCLYVSSFLLIPKLQTYHHLFLIGSGLLVSNVFLVEWYFQGTQAFPFITIRTLCVRFVTIIAIFSLIKKPSDLFLYYAIHVGSLLVNALINWSHARQSVRFVFKIPPFAVYIKPLFFIFSTVLVTSVYTLLDSVFLGFLSTDAEVGYYTTAVKVSKIFIMLLSALSTVLLPPLALAIHNRETNRAMVLLQKSYAYVCYLAVPISIGLFFLAGPIILLFAGNQYQEAIQPLRILSPTISIVGLNYVFGIQVLQATGNERYFFYATFVGMMVSIMFNLLLIPYFAGVGAAITNLLVEASVLAISFYFAIKKFNFGVRIDLVLKAVVASTPFFLLTYLGQYFDLSPVQQLLVTSFIGAISYLVIQHYIWRNLLLGELLDFVFRRG